MLNATVLARATVGASASISTGAGAGKSDSRSRDQYLGLRFWVDIQDIHVAEFAECSGLVIETEVFEYAEGGLNTYTHKLPVRTKYSNVTLKRGIDEGQDLFRWYMDTVNHKITRRNISILIYDTKGNVVRRWNLQNAFPVKWTGPDLKADAGAVAVETVEFAHEGLIPGGS